MNIHSFDNDAICLASSGGHVPTIKLLIDYGADVKVRDNEALICASDAGNFDVIKLLIDHGANARFMQNHHSMVT